MPAPESSHAIRAAIDEAVNSMEITVKFRDDTVVLSGEDFTTQNVLELTLPQLLEELGYQAGRIAVERNGEIVPKAQYGAVTLEDGDTLEVVRFVGGG